MNIPYKHFKNHQQYDDMEEFVKVHASFCKGTFTTSLNPKTSSTHQKICTACGSVAFTEIGEYRNTVKIYFKGYIRNEKIGLDRENKKYGHKLFNNHCVGCGVWFPSKTQSDLCPTCTAGHTEESYTNHDDFAESHADAIKVWQQGNPSEVNTTHDISNADRSRTLLKRINALKTNNGIYGYTRCKELEEVWILKQVRRSFRDASITHAAEAAKKAEKCHYVRNVIIPRERAEHCERLEHQGFYRTADRLLMKACIEAAQDNPLTSRRHMSEYAIYRKRTAPATTEYTKPPTKQATFTADLNPDIRECALSDVKNVPTNAEVIEVTRAKNHILSPSWPVLKAYKHNGDWMQYTAAFMAEMAQPGPIAEMKRIIKIAKDHPVYLTCFEKVGHCHRFLLLDWMNRLASI